MGVSADEMILQAMPTVTIDLTLHLFAIFELRIGMKANVIIDAVVSNEICDMETAHSSAITVLKTAGIFSVTKKHMKQIALQNRTHQLWAGVRLYL